jgi:Pyridoxamine 5'-phosphate oxidase
MFRELGLSRLVRIVGENVIDYPAYDGNSMYRTLGNIKRNPNAVREVDGKNRRIRINGKASIHTEKEFLERHYGAKFAVRIECELYPNCPRYIPNLTEKTSSSHVPRKDEAPPPPPEWKRRDYIREILLRDDPHRKGVLHARSRRVLNVPAFRRRRL